MRSFNCDLCGVTSSGRRMGQWLVEGTRNMEAVARYAGWCEGTLDATWYCLGCWKTRLGTRTAWQTRVKLDLVRPRGCRLPHHIQDQQFHDRNQLSLIHI